MHGRIGTKRHGCKQLKRYVMSLRLALLGCVVFGQRDIFFILGVLNDAVSSSDYSCIPSNIRKNDEK
jgi:hypothetical protein